MFFHSADAGFLVYVELRLRMTEFHLALIQNASACHETFLGMF
jgi:hypothetical protein